MFPKILTEIKITYLLGKTLRMQAKCLGGGREGRTGNSDIWEWSQANQNK